MGITLSATPNKSGQKLFHSMMARYVSNKAIPSCWFYHGTDEKGFNEILKAKSINPIYHHQRYNSPIFVVDGMVHLANGYSESEKNEKKLNAFYIALKAIEAAAYGNIIIKLHSSKFTNLYFDRTNKHCFTYDIIPVSNYKTDKYIKIRGTQYFITTIS
jgi:hypothetical protein